jgi:hypothetical protein
MKNTRRILTETARIALVLSVITFTIWVILTSMADYQYQTTNKQTDWVSPVGLFCDNAGNCWVEFRR